MVKGLKEAEAESTGFVQPEGEIRGGSNGCLLLPNKKVIEKMKPEVLCKMTKDRCSVAAREIPVGYMAGEGAEK